MIIFNCRLLGLLALSTLVVGCANPEVVQVGPNLFLLSRTDKAGIFGNESRMRAAVIRDANVFAFKQGMSVMPVKNEQTPMSPGSFASFDYYFKLIPSTEPAVLLRSPTQ